VGRVRRLLGRFLRPLYLRILPSLVVEDAWAPTTSLVPLTAIAPGATRPFRWFLEGETAVHPRSVEEVCDWLAGLSYAHDEALFHDPDFWQHPKTLEHLRKGDCEDLALWAWRKLLELGVDAEFFIGHPLYNPDWRSRHAWVVFGNGAELTILEPTWTRAEMLRPFAAHKHEYWPYFKVGRDCKPWACEGYWYYMRAVDGPVAPTPPSDSQAV
jgi:hypothetical protein